MAKEKTKSETSEVVYNTFQACNVFQLNGRNRRIVMKKYVGQEKTKTDWEEILKQDKILS